MPPTIPTALSRRVVQSTPGASSTSVTRAFSSTARCQSNKIPPESPLFINVPTPPLSQAVEDQHPDRYAKKGHLPLPRRVFKRRPNEIAKTDPEFLAKSAPLPTSEKAQLPPSSEHEARRRRDAEMRRKNLAEGIEELWKRRKTTEEASRIHDFTKQRYYQNARNAPRRDDEIFTDISIPASVLQTNVPRDPLRFQRALESKARTEAILARKSQDRKDAIQKLYMTARSFIVDEKALEKEVDKVFRPDTFSSGSTATGLRPENAWDLYGHPTTVQEMMRDLLRSDTKATSAYQEESSRTSKRQAKIAGELTGGPMDD